MDDQCNVCVANVQQEISIFHQVWLPSGELLQFRFCCIMQIINLDLET